MVALLATSQREEMEYADEVGDDGYSVETDRFDLHSWIRATFPDALTPKESAFLWSPIGDPDDTEIEAFMMDAEAAVAIGWTLGLVEDGDLSADHAGRIDHLRSIAPKPWDRADKLRKRIDLRSENAVWTARERWYLRHVRILLEDVDAPHDRADAISDVVADAATLDLDTEDGDILFAGKRLEQLDDEEFAMITSVVDAWTRALTWACSLGGEWDDLAIDEFD
jgi:hypothetical protein